MGTNRTGSIVNCKSPIVLHVEDDANDRLLLQIALRQAGLLWDLKAVKDGEEAIAYLQGLGPYSNRRLYAFPALVLLDLKLPRKSGFEVLEFIHEQWESKVLRVVVLSGSAQESDTRLAWERGAIHYFTKPPTLAELVHLTKEIHSQWLA